MRCGVTIGLTCSMIFTRSGSVWFGEDSNDLTVLALYVVPSASTTNRMQLVTLYETSQSARVREEEYKIKGRPLRAYLVQE